MKISKRVLAMVLCGILLLSGCGNQPKDGSPRKVALITKSTQTEFWKSVFAGATAAASEYNIELSIAGPETEEEIEAQNALIDQAVQDGAEAIVLSAISYDGNAAAVDRAVAAGVRVVVIDSDVHSDLVSARIGTDNVDAGRKAGETALHTKSGNLVVGLINFGQESRNSQEREQGVREVLEQDPRVTDIFSINALGNSEDACEKTKQLLEEHPQINVVIAFNEPTAVGAALAVDELGLRDSVAMVGFDSNVHTVDLMYTGIVSALIVQNPYAMGYLGVETANSVLNGKKYDPNALIDTSSVIVNRQNMFTTESQRALFPFN